MEAVIIVLTLSGGFAGSHLALSASSVRPRLVARLGKMGFMGAYSAIAYALFCTLVLYYYAHRFDGPSWLGLGDVSVVRWLAAALIVFSVVLTVTILGPAGYVESPTAIFSAETRSPRGLHRVTRHPMFVAVAAFSIGHILIAGHLIGIALFGPFAVLGVIGGLHQDAKLRARYGKPYEDYLEQTSFLPFAAIVAGRQKLAMSELPWLFIGFGVAAAWGVRELHLSAFAYKPHLVIAGVVIGSLGLTLWSWLRRSAPRK